MKNQNDFLLLKKELSKTKVNCKLGLTDKGEIHAICGWNYPDSVFHKIMDVSDPLDIMVEVSADTSGYQYKSLVRINNGPKSY